jgi:hypothetical protein
MFANHGAASTRMVNRILVGHCFPSRLVLRSVVRVRRAFVLLDGIAAVNDD